MAKTLVAVLNVADEGIILMYLALAVVLLSLRYTVAYKHRLLLCFYLWLCMYIFLTARLAIGSSFNELSLLQLFAILGLMILSGVTQAIVNTTMLEAERLHYN